jgi:hypothetical protein
LHFKQKNYLRAYVNKCLFQFRSDQYDPYVPRDGAAGGPPSKTQEIQKQIDDTVGIMRENISQVAQRGETLDALHDKTGKFIH